MGAEIPEPLPGGPWRLLLARGQTAFRWQQLRAGCAERVRICMRVLHPLGLGCAGLMNTRSVAAGTGEHPEATGGGGVWPPACGTAGRAFDLHAPAALTVTLAVKFVTKLQKDGLSRRRKPS